MKTKKLITPKFRITIGDYQLYDGIEVECFSSNTSHMDWCKIELSSKLQNILKFEDMDRAIVELGYDNDFDVLINGYVRSEKKDYWKEIIIKDDMMKLEKTIIKASFIDCTPQDIIRYIMVCSGVNDYILSDKEFGKRKTFVIDEKNSIRAIAEVNSSWGINESFFFQNKVFYWGYLKEQNEWYILEEGKTILSLNKYGELWEAETIAVPWIHHSQKLEIRHNKYNGIVTVSKTIIKSDATGTVRMYIYFRGE